MASDELPTKVTVLPITCVQLVLVPAPPAKLIAPARYWFAPPLNLNVVPVGILRSPKITIPAVGPDLGGVKLTVAFPLMVAVGQLSPVFFVNTSVTRLALIVALPLT